MAAGMTLSASLPARCGCGGAIAGSVAVTKYDPGGRSRVDDQGAIAGAGVGKKKSRSQLWSKGGCFVHTWFSRRSWTVGMTLVRLARPTMTQSIEYTP